jgi:hypothetical protein
MSVVDPVNPAPVEPQDPYANKAVVAAVTTLTGVLVQFLTTGDVSFDQEGATALVGGVATLLVYAISNRKRLFHF